MRPAAIVSLKRRQTARPWVRSSSEPMIESSASSRIVGSHADRVADLDDQVQLRDRNDDEDAPRERSSGIGSDPTRSYHRLHGRSHRDDVHEALDERDRPRAGARLRGARPGLRHRGRGRARCSSPSRSPRRAARSGPRSPSRWRSSSASSRGCEVHPEDGLHAALDAGAHVRRRQVRARLLSCPHRGPVDEGASHIRRSARRGQVRRGPLPDRRRDGAGAPRHAGRGGGEHGGA